MAEPHCPFILQVLGTIDVIAQSQLYKTVFHTLRKTCIKHAIVPDSLFLPRDSIQLKDDKQRPREIGGFADIYLGQWMDRAVCIKALRIMNSGALDGPDPVMKVSQERKSLVTSGVTSCRVLSKRQHSGGAWTIPISPLSTDST